MSKNVRKLVAAATAAMTFIMSCSVAFAVPDGSGEEVYTKTEDYGNGMTYYESVYRNGTYGREDAHYLTISPDSSVDVITLANDEICGSMDVNGIMKYASGRGYNVLGAVNADFFYSGKNVPEGIVVEDGVYKSSPEGNTSLLIGADGKASVLDVTGIQITLNNNGGSALADNSGQTVKLTHFNKIRANGGGLYLMDEYFSSEDTQTSSDGWYVKFKILDGVMKTNGSMKLQVVEKVQSAYPLDIGKGYMVLTADTTSGREAEFEKFAVGDQITLTTYAWGNNEVANCRWASGAGDQILRDGELTDSTKWNQSILWCNPRTAVGVKADGTMVFYTIDGRQKGYSNGIQLKQLAEEMKALGCVDVLNMAGGNNTVLALQLPGSSGAAVQNIPCNGNSTASGSWILFTENAEAGSTVKHLFLENNGLVVYQGDSVTLKPMATNGKYTTVALPSDVSISKQSGLGILNGTKYTAPWKADDVTLTLKSESTGATGKACIKVVNRLSTISTAYNGNTVTSLTLKRGQRINLTSTATYNGRSVIIDQDSFVYSISDNLGSITADGTVTIDSDAGGKGKITIFSGGITNTVNVLIEGSFPDTTGHWADKYIFDLKQKGIVNGIPGGNFGPNDGLKRCDFMIMLYKAAGSPPVTGALKWTDVKDNAYYSAALKWAQYEGIAQGSGGKFMPNDKLSREQAFAFVARYLSRNGTEYDCDASVLLQYSDRASLSAYAKKPAAILTELGIVSGSDGKLNPKATLTRGEMARILSDTLKKEGWK